MDRGFDGKVERTRARPLPSGAVSPLQAILFLLLLLFAGLLVLLQFNNFTIILGLSSLVLVAIYPLMKRYTHWPQLVLGLTINWGALMGWAAVHQSLAWPAVSLYGAGVFWTLGYDTIYALQDMDDDALIGVKSTALLFKEKSRQWIAGFYASAAILILVAGQATGKGSFYYLVVMVFVAQLTWQLSVLRPENTESCLRIFKSNTYAGWFLFVGLIAANQL
jgi:4-hydroxybenzoate polyprenyltransferase